MPSGKSLVSHKVAQKKPQLAHVASVVGGGHRKSHNSPMWRV